jgi:uncharacterized protein (TIGR03435 family)
MRVSMLIGAALFVASAPAVFTQSPEAVRGPAFDVVSIRQAPGAIVLNNREERPGGGYLLTKGSIATLISQAYAISSVDVVGLPAWARNEAYDITATASLTRPTREERSALKQALLARRFAFRAHVEMREQEAFDLVAARGVRQPGPGLVPYEFDCVALATASREARAAGDPEPESRATECNIHVTRTGLGGAMPMDLLASVLRTVVGRPVVDKTGITGTYRVKLTFDQPAAGNAGAVPSETLPSIFNALPEQLGLKLVPSRTMMQVLVVDAIERPAEN